MLSFVLGSPRVNLEDETAEARRDAAVEAANSACAESACLSEWIGAFEEAIQND